MTYRDADLKENTIYTTCRRKGLSFSSCQTNQATANPEAFAPFLGFTRLFDGSVGCFLVLGYTEHTINGLPYHQAAGVYIPTTSLSSFISTLHSSLLCKDALKDAFENPFIIPISLHRLVLGKTLVLKYGVSQVERYGVAYMKLCIKQIQPIAYSEVLQCVSCGIKHRPYDTRSICNKP